MTLFMPISKIVEILRAVPSQAGAGRHARQSARILVQVVLTACLAVALFTPLLVQAAAYGSYDLRQLLVPAAGGGPGGSVSIRYLDGMLDDLALHAGNYPPQFDSAQDRTRAQRDVANLMGVLDAAFGSHPTSPEILLRMGRIGAVGHNLELPNAADYAASRFARLLAIDSQHAMGNYHYGQFLAGTGRLKESEPYLIKAREKGVIGASYALGIVYLGHGNQQKALTYLSEYQKAVPSDVRIGELVRAIRDGKVEVKGMEGSK